MSSQGHPSEPTAGPLAQQAQHRLGQRQAALVAALVTGGPLPPGFDAAAVHATRDAILRKRAGDAGHAWPAMASALGSRWAAAFAIWAAHRSSNGAVRDGWDFARDLRSSGALPAAAAVELAAREVSWRYDGSAAPRRRRLPAVRPVGGRLLVQIGGRVAAVPWYGR